MNLDEARKRIEELERENEMLRAENRRLERAGTPPEGCIVIDPGVISRHLDTINRGTNAKVLWAILAGSDERGQVGMKATDLALNIGLKSRRGWGELTGALEKIGLVDRWGTGHVQGLRLKFVPSAGTYRRVGNTNVPAAGTINLAAYREMYRGPGHRKKNVPEAGTITQFVPEAGTNPPFMYVCNHNIDTHKSNHTYTAPPPTPEDEELLRFLWSEIRFHRNGWQPGLFDGYGCEEIKEAALVLKEQQKQRKVKSAAGVLRKVLTEGEELPKKEKEQTENGSSLPKVDYSDIIES